MDQADITQVGKVLTTSGLFGACSAYALKTVGKKAAAAVGFGFIALQALSYYGIVTVNWLKIEQKAIQSLDQNNDGKLDASDLKVASNNVLAILSKGVPSSAGFVAGFYAGLKWI